MFNVTGGEVVIIVLVALVVLGPDRIPEVARNIGRLINKAKSMSEGFQSTVSDITDDPSMKPLKDLGELAARPRQKLAEFAAEAEAEERAERKLQERARMDAEQIEAALLSGAEVADAEVPGDGVADGDIGAPPERPVSTDPSNPDSTDSTDNDADITQPINTQPSSDSSDSSDSSETEPRSQ